MATVNEVADAITARKAEHDGQLVVAIAGAPASGKSTLAGDLLLALKDAIILPMDGFHLDNAVLADRDLSERKGAPQTFDVAGLRHMLERLRGGEEIIAPVFDRELDVARAGAVVISPEHDIVLVEGNYLLLNEAPWQGLHSFWDMTVMMDVPREVLRERLLHRWLGHGLGTEKAHAKADNNDMPNAEKVLTGSIKADLVVNASEL